MIRSCTLNDRNHLSGIEIRANMIVFIRSVSSDLMPTSRKLSMRSRQKRVSFLSCTDCSTFRDISLNQRSQFYDHDINIKQLELEKMSLMTLMSLMMLKKLNTNTFHFLMLSGLTPLLMISSLGSCSLENFIINAKITNIYIFRTTATIMINN